jgi:glycosyltransferase involved in cell wall biosynthesis
MGAPFISVCIPSYQRVEYLERLLNSIRQQTYGNFEVVLSDDSPDDSVKMLLEKYIDLPIHYYQNVPAAGTPLNWNLAIEKAKGDWIKIMHDDDWFSSPVSLERFAKEASESKSLFLFSSSRYIKEDGSERVRNLSPEEIKGLHTDPLYLVYDNLIGHPSAVLHKKDLAILYNPSYKWVVDMDFYIHYLNQHPGWEYIAEPLVNIGEGSTQVSVDCYKNPDVEIPEYLQLLNTLDSARVEHNRYVFYTLWNLVKKFKLKDISQVEKHYRGPVPTALSYIINIQNKIPRLILKQTPWSKYFMRKAFQAYPGLNK